MISVILRAHSSAPRNTHNEEPGHSLNEENLPAVNNELAALAALHLDLAPHSLDCPRTLCLRLCRPFPLSEHARH
jgi:hypothetical protein